jgi:signal transduction histidine kinase
MKTRSGTATRRARTTTGSSPLAEPASRIEDLERQLKEALEQQAATGEILRLISSSPNDVRPVLDAVAESAARLCRADDVIIRLVEGTTNRLAAHHGSIPVLPTRIEMQTVRESIVGRAILDRKTVHVYDTHDPRAQAEFPYMPPRAEGTLPRTFLVAPLLHQGSAVGAIVMRRIDPAFFTEEQIKLLETFAAQAVIAIENVRLFKELQARNAELTESLEQQTVTSEILRIISSSPTDTQPVFDAIVNSGVHLFGGMNMSLRLVKGDYIERVASTLTLDEPAQSRGELRIAVNDPQRGTSRAIVRREVVQLPDILADEAANPRLIEQRRTHGFRALLAAPLLRDNEAIGVISITRATPGPFTDKQIALLKTFASQAVIAIENVRLFNELQTRNAELSESLAQQTATAEILKVISSSPTDTQPVFDAIVKNCGSLFHDSGVGLWLVNKNELHPLAVMSTSARLRNPVPIDRLSAVGACVLDGGVRHLPDLEIAAEQYPRTGQLGLMSGYKSGIYAPLLHSGQAIGALAVVRRESGAFDDTDIALLCTFADQAVIAIENVRLFKEIQQKSAELEVANRHKSEFLASMSHELRTPLNAILGFSEVLSEQMFGEVNAKQAEYLHDIHTSGAHLLSLINDILDLSKIEAGRMDLELSEFDIAQALENALSLMRERATRHGINLDLRCEPGIGPWTADERKFKQIMLNLLSNGVKFTPAGGSIAVRAASANGAIEISVTDTGVGIRPEDQALVFEEFRQVGSDSGAKAQGTGLGLALTKKFVELHGGTIGVHSEPGRGSTFSFTLPAEKATK